MKNQVITAKLLVSMGACHEQVKLFRKLFGTSVKVTLKGCVKAASQFDFNWAAKNLLSAPAYAEYQRVRAPAYAECQRVTDAAYAEYQRVRDAAYAEYQKECAIPFALCVKEWGIE
jgi:hypothetical protein